MIMKQLGILFLLVFYSTASFGAGICDEYFIKRTQGSYLPESIEIPARTKITKEGGEAVTAKKMISEEVQAITGKKFTGKTFEEAIESVFEAIKKQGGEYTAQVDKMAKFAEKLNPALEKYLAKFPIKGTKEAPDLAAWSARHEALDQVKAVRYKIQSKIHEIEGFKPDDFIKVDADDFLITRGNNEKQLTHMALDDYPEYVKSWVHYNSDATSNGAKLFNQIDEGSLGVLSIGQIRDINSYNRWPMYLKEHDMRHIHYGLSHPMALATVFRASRSKNHMRYTMIGGMFEGVDRVQYNHETLLNKFFGRDKGAKEIFGIDRNVDLEEALLLLGTSSQENLERIAAKSGASGQIREFASELGDWRPKKVMSTNFEGKAKNGLELDEDIEHMVFRFKNDVRKAANMNDQIQAGELKELTEAQEQFMKEMNFQVNPENPEIIIDGIRFKNDGRGHYSGDYSDPTPIGIGEQ